MNKMKLYDIYKEIADKTQNKAIINGELNLPETILRSSFIKCLEFNLITSKYEDENLYFYLPILRSICEDIIFINYMFTVIEEEDRLNFIIAYQASDWQKSITAQETYFTANRSFQPILTTKMINDLILSKINIEAIQQTLKNKYSWKRKVPTVKQIANDGNMINLYDYLYAATSRLVHFNPQTLLQMIWGEFETKEKQKIKLMNISIEHYKKYYNKFCLFYGFTLFKIFSEKFDYILDNKILEEI